MQALQLNCIAYINVKFVGLVLVIREKEELENDGRDHWFGLHYHTEKRTQSRRPDTPPYGASGLDLLQ